MTTGTFQNLEDIFPARALIGFALLVCLGLPLRAQSGAVKFGNQPVPGATITAVQGGQRVTVTTDPSGHYELPPLAKGAWTIEASNFGFQTAKKEITVADAPLKVDFSLQLAESQMARRLRTGASQQDANSLESQLQGEMNANAPEQPGAAPENSNEAFLVSGSLSQGLNPNAAPDTGPPMNFGGMGGAGNPGAGGQFGQAGGVPGGGGGPGGPGGGFGGGGFGGGGGRFGGGGQFGRQGQRGGPPNGRQFGNRRAPSQIRGLLFFTLNNSVLDAKPFSISGADVPQPSYAQSRFGLIIGGPLLIPKIIHDRATFFNLTYTGIRNRTPYTAVETVPTLAERQGNFSQAVDTSGAVQIYNPLTHQPFPGDVIPASMLNPTALKLLQYFPLPAQPGLQVNNYDFQTAAPQNSDSVGLRVFRNITKADRLAYHVNYQRRDGDNSQPFGFLDSLSGYGLTTDLTWTRNLTPDLISNARVSFNRNRNETTPFFANGPNVAEELGILGTSTNPLNYGPPNLNFTNFGGLTDAVPVLTRNQGQTFGESLLWVHGQHNIQYGIQFGRNDLSTDSDPNGRGTFNFTGIATSELTASGQPVPGTGFDLADFLLGLPQSSSIRYGETSTYFRQNVWSGFIQDEWKLRPNLTINIGLRDEYFSPYYEKYGQIANLWPSPDFTGVTRVLPGTPGIPAGTIKPDYLNPGPRFGLTWKVPWLKRSTIVRAGYGIYYNGQAYNLIAPKLAQQPPFAVSESVNTSAANVLTLEQGFLAALPGDITNTYAIGANYKTPYAQTWNLTVQHELPHGMFLETGYVGTKGTHLDVLTLPNEGPTASLSSSEHNQLGNAVGFTYDSSVGNSILNAFHARFSQRFRRGVSFTANYAFSKSIDDSSTFGGVGNTTAQNWLDLAAERGLSSFDRRQVFDANWIFTSPVGAVGSRIAPTSLTGRLLKDWQLTGSVTAETGTPLTARALGNTAQLAQTNGVGSERADATGLPVETGTGFFNLAAFVAPPAGQFGNAGRNTIPGPGLVALNLTFGRAFALDESRRRLELRFEANNVLNQVSFTNLNTVVNATNYGLPSAASAMRSVDIALRFRF